MKNPIKALLGNLRRRTVDTPDQPVGTSRTPGDPYNQPHYPMKFHPTDHNLPYGIPVRGDIVLWVDKEINRHTAAETLDEGTPAILDVEIDRQHLQWQQAISQYAHAERTRTALGIRDDQVHSLAAKREQLVQARREVDRLASLEAHYRDILAGAPVTVPGTYAPTPAATQPASEGLTQAQVPGLSSLEDLLSARPSPPHPPTPNRKDHDPAPERPDHAGAGTTGHESDQTVRDITFAAPHPDHDEDGEDVLAAV